MSNFVNVELPSKCKAYKDVDPESIKIRPYTGAEEQKIAQLRGVNFENKFAEILSDVLVGINPKKLTLGDRLYLAIWETINSYNSLYGFDVRCAFCGKKHEVTVDLSKLDICYLPDNFKQPFPVTLTNGDKVNLKLLTVADEISIDKYSESHESWNYRWGLTLDNDKDPIANEIYISKLNSNDLMVIRGFQEVFTHGPVLKTTKICDRCDEEMELDIPFRLEDLILAGKELLRCVREKFLSDVLSKDESK